MSQELKDKGYAVKSVKMSHGIHGDQTLVVFMDLEAKGAAGMNLMLVAYDSSGTVVEKSDPDYAVKGMSPGCMFLVPRVLEGNYALKKQIAYFELKKAD